MIRRQPAFPHLWLMTDERQSDRLWEAVCKLPRGAGIVFRHHATPRADRRRLFDRVRRVAVQRGLFLIVAGDDRRLRGHGSHHRRPGPPRIGTAPAHDLMEIRAAERSGATAILLSPVFPTRSHPGAPALGILRFAALARATRLPVIALGGMNRHSAIRTDQVGGYGWAAIDAWTGGR
jgi:thiamine-phosphate pyrophosphorylase